MKKSNKKQFYSIPKLLATSIRNYTDEEIFIISLLIENRLEKDIAFFNWSVKSVEKNFEMGVDRFMNLRFNSVQREVYTNQNNLNLIRFYFKDSKLYPSDENQVILIDIYTKQITGGKKAKDGDDEISKLKKIVKDLEFENNQLNQRIYDLREEVSELKFQLSTTRSESNNDKEKNRIVGLINFLSSSENCQPSITNITEDDVGSWDDDAVDLSNGF